MENSDTLEKSLAESSLTEEDDADRDSYAEDLLTSILDAGDDDLGMELPSSNPSTVNSPNHLSTRL